MSGPTPTPTPREVLASAYCFSVHTRPGAPLDFSNELRPIGRPCEDCLRCADEALAALAATGDAPLSAEHIARLRTASHFIEPADAGKEFRNLLTAYTTLAAQGAALRAERDALRERVADVLKAQAYYGGGTAEDLAERVNAALATPARPTDTGRDG